LGRYLPVLILTAFKDSVKYFSIMLASLLGSVLRDLVFGSTRAFRPDLGCESLSLNNSFCAFFGCLLMSFCCLLRASVVCSMLRA
jgi:hypothetical protein